MEERESPAGGPKNSQKEKTHEICRMAEERYPIEIITTEDGSHSLFRKDLNETYHSRHGAVQESIHVFIRNGLDLLKDLPVLKILEVGFGTGLNAWLTLDQQRLSKQQTHYTSLETLPLSHEIYSELTYAEKDTELFQTLHTSPWETEVAITENFHLLKKKISIQEFAGEEKFDLIYYDAFGPPTQPEMWTADIFTKLAAMMKTGAILVTYCAKGQVRRDMESAGLHVERLQGPPGKREMLRAIKHEKKA